MKAYVIYLYFISENRLDSYLNLELFRTKFITVKNICSYTFLRSVISSYGLFFIVICSHVQTKNNWHCSRIASGTFQSQSRALCSRANFTTVTALLCASNTANATIPTPFLTFQRQ